MALSATYPPMPDCSNCLENRDVRLTSPAYFKCDNCGQVRKIPKTFIKAWEAADKTQAQLDALAGHASKDMSVAEAALGDQSKAGTRHITRDPMEARGPGEPASAPNGILEHPQEAQDEESPLDQAISEGEQHASEPEIPDVVGSAIVGGERNEYRYRLTRVWDPSSANICWVMLNPSTADATEDDPTIRRLIGFSKAWNFGSLTVVNLYAWRATQPQDLRAAQRHAEANIVGPANNQHIGDAARSSNCLVAAWGANILSLDGGLARASEVMGFFQSIRPVKCLGQTTDHTPKHPLYLPGDTTLETYTLEEYTV